MIKDTTDSVEYKKILQSRGCSYERFVYHLLTHDMGPSAIMDLYLCDIQDPINISKYTACDFNT